LTAGTPDVGVVVCGEADAPWAAAENDGISAGDDPCTIPVALIVIEKAVVVEGAVLVDSTAAIGSISFSVALPFTSVG
jgi:hypothetical protein